MSSVRPCFFSSPPDTEYCKDCIRAVADNSSVVCLDDLVILVPISYLGTN